MAIPNRLQTFLHHRKDSTEVFWGGPRNGQAVLEVNITRATLGFWSSIANVELSSFSILHGPTPKERELMDEWIKILVAFVNNDKSYDFGTRSVNDMKVASSDATVKVETDVQWETLAGLGDVFAGCG